MGSVNMNNFADDVASIHLANVEHITKTGDLLDWGKRKYFGGSSSSILIWKWLTLMLQNQLNIQLSPKKDAWRGFSVSSS